MLRLSRFGKMIKKNLSSKQFYNSQQNNKSNDSLRIIVLSDTHGRHHSFDVETTQSNTSLPSGDILIHCGDFSEKGRWDYARDFATWFEDLPGYQAKILVDGNHDRDILFDQWNVATLMAEYAPSVHLLQDNLLAINLGSNDVRPLFVYGVSWDSCKQMADLTTQIPLAMEGYQTIPSNSTGSTRRVPQLDILMAHQNPKLSSEWIPSFVHPSRSTKGNPQITRAALVHEIPLVLGGHIHWKRGVTNVQATTFVNASNQSYHKSPNLTAPVVIDYNLETRTVLYVDCPPHTDYDG